MKNHHELIYERTVDAINALFADTSVSKETTEQDLHNLLEMIEILMENLT